MVKLKQALSFLAALVSLGAALFIVIQTGLPRAMGNRHRPGASYIAAVGSPAPPFILRNQSNNLISLESGVVTILNFWSTSCEPCRREMRELQQLSEDIPDLLRILAINLGDSRPVISAWRDEYGLNFDLLRDPTFSVARRYQIRGLPTTYLLDERQIVRAIYFGPISYDQMLDAVQRLALQA